MRTFRTNERIYATNVQLILSDGKNFGQVSKSEALKMARAEGKDLVEVSQGVIPTCKIMDFGKMQYEQKKSEKHKQHPPAMKEIRIGYKTEEHDIQIKRKKVEEFLAKGHRVLFAMDVKGRERYVAGNAAKEKFTALVMELSSVAKASDIQENGNGYNTTLHPVG